MGNIKPIAYDSYTVYSFSCSISDLTFLKNKKTIDHLEFQLLKPIP